MVKDCSCCVSSRIPLRGQLILLLVVCAVIFVILAPIVVFQFKGLLSTTFEEDVAVGNLHRSFASMQKVLKHEEEMLVADAVWDGMADASIEMSLTNSTDNFYEFIIVNLFNYRKWSDWACGNMLAVYDKDSEDGDPYLRWSEFHATNDETYQIDKLHISPTPSIFQGKTEESLKFLRQIITFNTSVGLIAADEGVFTVVCRAITHVDPNDTAHGYLCRVTDIRRYIKHIASGAGACVSFYNMAGNSTPKEIRDRFAGFKAGTRTLAHRYDGEFDIETVVTQEWNCPSYPHRICGPAEKLVANSTRRTLLSFRLQSNFGVDDSKGNQSGIAFVLDNAQEFQPILENTFLILTIIFDVFAFAIYVIYGTFTEFKVLRSLHRISKIAYMAFVKDDEEYEQYIESKKSGANPRRVRTKNEILQMASMAAMAVKKTIKEYEKMKNELLMERIESSLIADQLRLLALWCCRSTPLHTSRGESGKIESKQKEITGVVVGNGEVVKETVTFDRVLNDPFATEMFKNMAVDDPTTGFTEYPARQPLLFLLSVLFYRSLSDATPVEFRLECIQGILDEFFDLPDSNVYTKPSKSLSYASSCEEELGISFSECNKVILECNKCVSTRRPDKTIFDEAAKSVRHHLKHDIFPQFVKSPAFLMIRLVFAEKSKASRKDVSIDDVQVDQTKAEPSATDSSTRLGPDDNASTASTSSSSKVSELVNSTEGTELSHRAFNYLSATLF